MCCTQSVSGRRAVVVCSGGAKGVCVIRNIIIIIITILNHVIYKNKYLPGRAMGK